MVLGLTAVLGALASPLGHSAGLPHRTPLTWTARTAGSCPFEPGAPAVTACAGRWTLGPAAIVTHRSRTLFMVIRETRRLVVPFAVRFDARGAGCDMPWIDHMTFNTRAPKLCLGGCPERIELRAPGGAAYPLVRVGGIAAEGGRLRCGERYRGSWTFDVAGAPARLDLHYPGFADLPIDAS